MRPGIYLPDDLEQRYARLKATIFDQDRPESERLEAMHTLQEWHRHWQDKRCDMTWRERRRIRSLTGEPATPVTGQTHAQRSLDEDQWYRKTRTRLKREYGPDGLRRIEDLVDKLWWKRPRVPKEQAYTWAENVYLRER